MRWHWWRWWRRRSAAKSVVTQAQAQPELRNIHVLRARWVSAAAAHFDPLLSEPLLWQESRSDPYKTERMESVEGERER